MRMRNLLCFLILSASFLETKGRTCFWTASYAVHVVNNITPAYDLPLEVHCASGDNDLGEQMLYYKQEFSWSFCQQLFLRTLFFCTLRWGLRSKSFDSFNSDNRTDCTGGECSWEAQNDGIYFSGGYPPSNLKKVYSWPDVIANEAWMEHGL